MACASLFLALAVLCKLSVWSSPLTNVSGTAGQVDPFDAMFFLGWTPTPSPPV
jgi:hypothetical protein